MRLSWLWHCENTVARNRSPRVLAKPRERFHFLQLIHVCIVGRLSWDVIFQDPSNSSFRHEKNMTFLLFHGPSLLCYVEKVGAITQGGECKLGDLIQVYPWYLNIVCKTTRMLGRSWDISYFMHRDVLSPHNWDISFSLVCFLVHNDTNWIHVFIFIVCILTFFSERNRRCFPTVMRFLSVESFLWIFFVEKMLLCRNFTSFIIFDFILMVLSLLFIATTPTIFFLIFYQILIPAIIWHFQCF